MGGTILPGVFIGFHLFGLVLVHMCVIIYYDLMLYTNTYYIHKFISA